MRDVDYVAWQCDQDAYACSGQKCSAQSMLFAHANWARVGLYAKMEELASRCVACVRACVLVCFTRCVRTRVREYG